MSGITQNLATLFDDIRRVAAINEGKSSLAQAGIDADKALELYTSEKTAIEGGLAPSDEIVRIADAFQAHEQGAFFGFHTAANLSRVTAGLPAAEFDGRALSSNLHQARARNTASAALANQHAVRIHSTAETANTRGPAGSETLRGGRFANINVPGFFDLLNQEDVYLIDLRSPEEIQAQGSANLAPKDGEARFFNVPLRELEAKEYDSATLAKDLEKLNLDPNKPIVFLCRTGNRSLHAASEAVRILEQKSESKTRRYFSLVGGIYNLLLYGQRIIDKETLDQKLGPRPEGQDKKDKRVRTPAAIKSFQHRLSLKPSSAFYANYPALSPINASLNTDSTSDVRILQLRGTGPANPLIYLQITKEGYATVVDPVLEDVEKIIRILEREGAQLTHIFATHVHADHLSGAGTLQSYFENYHGYRPEIVIGAASGATGADIYAQHEQLIKVDPKNEIVYKAKHAPGHTKGDTIYDFVMKAKRGAPQVPLIFTGDVLSVGGTGRADFQEGSPKKLHQSIQGQAYSHTSNPFVLTGHGDGEVLTTVEKEKNTNAFIRPETHEDEFVRKRGERDAKLSPPGKLGVAVPYNSSFGKDKPGSVRNLHAALARINPAARASQNTARLLLVAGQEYLRYHGEEVPLPQVLEKISENPERLASDFRTLGIKVSDSFQAELFGIIEVTSENSQKPGFFSGTELAGAKVKTPELKVVETKPAPVKAEPTQAKSLREWRAAQVESNYKALLEELSRELGRSQVEIANALAGENPAVSGLISGRGLIPRAVLNESKLRLAAERFNLSYEGTKAKERDTETVERDAAKKAKHG